jgi:hypothetical protein
MSERMAAAIVYPDAANADLITTCVSRGEPLTVYGVRYVPETSPRYAVIDLDTSDVQRLFSALAKVTPHAISVGFLSLREALREYADPADVPTVTDAEARAMRAALRRLDRREGRR